MLTPPQIRWLFHGSIVVRNYATALNWLQRYCGCRVLLVVVGGCCEVLWVSDCRFGLQMLFVFGLIPTRFFSVHDFVQIFKHLFPHTRTHPESGRRTKNSGGKRIYHWMKTSGVGGKSPPVWVSKNIRGLEIHRTKSRRGKIPLFVKFGWI